MRRPGPRSVVWFAAALAAVSVGLAAGPLPWRFAGESGLPEPAPVASATPAAAPVALDPILALQPFGRLAEPAAPEAAVETALGLTLHGVAIARRPEASSAIISGAEAPARAYAVGQDITGSAALLEVHAGHVVLSVDGRRETLSFPQRRRAAPSVDSGVAALQALVTGQEPAPGEAAPAAPDPEAVIAEYRDLYRANPMIVLGRLGLVATEEGYSVSGSAPAGVLRAGLRPGDVVAKVNGQQVGNLDADRGLFDEVVASGRARLEVLRDGQRVVMSFPLR